jgi:hypothetical protein
MRKPLAAAAILAILVSAQVPLSARAEDAAFCARLRRLTDAAKVGFKTIRGEFRAGRTASGVLVTRTYSNVELWADTACFFGVDNGATMHSCEIGFDKDDAAARARRDALVGELRACLARDLAGPPVLADAAVHSARLPLSGDRALTIAVSAAEADGMDGRVLISVRARE